jgi:hypothetical protein
MNEIKPASQRIIEYVGTPTRWRTLDVLNQKRRVYKRIFKQLEPELNAHDHAILKEYNIQVDLRENELKTQEARKEINTSDLFTPVQQAKLKKALLEEHQENFKKILNETKEQPASETPAQEEHKAKRKPAAFIPNWHNKPEHVPPLVTLGSISVLTSENISCLIAAAGYGKSSICESILSSVLNKNCDSLGFNTGDSVKRALYIDIERTPADTWNSFYRMNLRARISKETDTSEQVFIAGLKEYTSKDARKTKIEELCEEFKPQLLLIDGAAALVTSINSEEEAGLIVSWLFELTWRYKLGVITTLHPNKTTETPRGHLGSFLTNEAENMFIVRKNELTGVRTISTTKERNSAQTSSAFCWSDELGFMVSCENVKAGRIAKPTAKDSLTELDIRNLRIAFTGKTFKYEELCKTLRNYLNEEHPALTISQPATKIFVSELQADNVIIKSGKTPHTIYGFAPVQSKEILFSNN